MTNFGSPSGNAVLLGGGCVIIAREQSCVNSLPLNLELENKMLIALICVCEAIYCNLCTCSVIHIKCIWAVLGGRATFLPFKNS